MSMKKMKTFAVNGEQFEIMDEFARNNNNDTNINYFMQNNLLINSNFANPINQRGNDSLSVLPSVGAYTIDRWKATNISLTLNSGHITAKSYDGSKLKLLQIIEFPTLYSNKTLTASLKYRVREFDNSTDAQLQIEADGVVASTVNLICDETWHVAKTTSKLGTVSSELRYNLMVTGKGEIDIEWAKLELGEEATPYVPRLYAEEYLLCLRYFQLLHMRDSKLYLCNADIIAFCKTFIAPMRVTPSCDISELKIFSNTAEQSGYTVSHTASTKEVNVSFTKNSHGMTYASYLSVGGTIKLDAEME